MQQSINQDSQTGRTINDLQVDYNLDYQSRNPTIDPKAITLTEHNSLDQNVSKIGYEQAS